MSKKRSQKQLLAGHKQIGKRFVPPMRQIPRGVGISYVNNMLPELIWIGLLNERLGYARGARVIEKVFLAAAALKEKGQEGNYALISSFDMLRDQQKIHLAQVLHEDGVLETLQEAIAPLVLLYQKCPLSFLGPPSTAYSKEDLVLQIKVCTGKTIDRYDTPGIVLYGAMLIYRLVTKTIHLPSNIQLPDFNSVVDSPGSDEAKEAAGFLRSSGLAEFGMLKLPDAWARHFWDMNATLSPCEFSNEQ
jgi:hypothetical protein